jgi:hypothetical protein
MSSPSESPHPASPIVLALKPWPYDELGCDGQKDSPRSNIEGDHGRGRYEFDLRVLAEPCEVDPRDVLCRTMRRLIGHYNETLAWLEDVNALRRISEAETEKTETAVEDEWNPITDVVVWASLAAERSLVRAVLVNGGQAKYNGDPKPDWRPCGWRLDDRPGRDRESLYRPRDEVRPPAPAPAPRKRRRPGRLAMSPRGVPVDTVRTDRPIMRLLRRHRLSQAPGLPDTPPWNDRQAFSCR